MHLHVGAYEELIMMLLLGYAFLFNEQLQFSNIPPIKFFTAPPALMLASIDNPKTVNAKYSGDRNS